MTIGKFDEIHDSDNKIKILLKCWTKKEAIIKLDSRGLVI